MALFFFLLKIKEKLQILQHFHLLSIQKVNHDVFSLLNESAACVSFKKCASHINVGPT